MEGVCEIIVSMQIMLFYIQFCIYTSLVASKRRNNISHTKYIVLILIRHHSAKVYTMWLIVTHEMEGVCGNNCLNANHAVFMSNFVYTLA